MAQRVKHRLQCWRPGVDPWMGKILWRRKLHPIPVFLPGKPHGRRSLVGYSPWGHKESDMTERLHSLHFYLIKSYRGKMNSWHTSLHPAYLCVNNDVKNWGGCLLAIEDASPTCWYWQYNTSYFWFLEKLSFDEGSNWGKKLELARQFMTCDFGILSWRLLYWLLRGYI